MKKLADTYEDLKKSGRLIILPVAIGDKVYVVERPCSLPNDCDREPCELCPNYELDIIEQSFSLGMLDEVEKTVFVTREEAEAAIERKRGKQYE